MFRLPFAFIVTGIASFLLFHVLTFADFAGWLGAAVRGPEGWFHIHLLVLGWATMIAMGAVYQLIHVVVQTELYSKKLGFVHYALFTVGTTGLLIGFRFLHTPWIAAFATLACAGIILFAWNTGATLLKAKQWNPITVSAAAAVGYLVRTAVSGMLMGLNFELNFLGPIHERLFGTHIWLGTVGWFGLLITGFSYKMLPMFYLAHDYPQKLQLATLLLWNAAVWLGAIGFLSGSRACFTLALAALSAALVVYNFHLRQIGKHKHKKAPGAGIEWTLWSSVVLMVVTVSGTAAIVVNPELGGRSTVVVFYLWMYVYGWVGITIMGYLSKIVPFLWWTHKYGPHAGKKQVSTMGQLLAEKPIHIGLAVIVLCLSGLLAGFGLNNMPLIAAAGSLLCGAAIFYMSMISLVFTK